MSWAFEVFMTLAHAFARALGEHLAGLVQALVLGGGEVVHPDFASAIGPALVYEARCQGCGWSCASGDVPTAAQAHATAHGHHVEVSASGSVIVDPEEVER